MNRRFFAPALALSLLGFLPAPYGGKLEVPLPDQPVTLDPALATRESEFQVTSLVHDPLYRLDGRGIAKPHLVLPDPELSKNNLSWTLKLRPGLLLSNGKPLRAAQVAASLRRVNQGPSAHLVAIIRSIKPVGQDVLQLTLRAPCPHLPLLLSAPATGVAVSQGKDLVGSGPFRLASATGSAILLKANPRHFAGRPYLNELRFRVFESTSAEVAAFQAGAVHLSLNGASLFGGSPRQVVSGVESPACSTLFLGVGSTPGYLADSQLRLALLTAIDRPRLARLMGGGKRTAAKGPVCSRLMGKTRRPPTFSRKTARRLLTRAAARVGELGRAMASGARPQLELLVDSSRPEDRALARQIVADLDGVGISAHIEVRMAAEYQARLQSGRYQLILGRMKPQIPQGNAALATAFALAGKSKVARDCMIKRPCGRQSAAWFMTRLPLLPLLHMSTRVHHDARLGGLTVDPLGEIRYADVYWVRR